MYAGEYFKIMANRRIGVLISESSPNLSDFEIVSFLGVCVDNVPLMFT